MGLRKGGKGVPFCRPPLGMALGFAGLGNAQKKTQYVTSSNIMCLRLFKLYSHILLLSYQNTHTFGDSRNVKLCIECHSGFMVLRSLSPERNGPNHKFHTSELDAFIAKNFYVTRTSLNCALDAIMG